MLFKFPKKKKKKIIIIKMCYNQKKYSGDDNMKKLFLIVILALTTVSCELFSPSYWNRVTESRRENGERCYIKNGNAYCVDRDGNRLY